MHWRGGLAEFPLLLFPVPCDRSGRLSWGQTDMPSARGLSTGPPLTISRVDSWAPGSEGAPVPTPQGPIAILLVLFLEAIRALRETLCLAQLPAQLLLVGLLHGFDGWKQGREVEGRLGRGQQQQAPLPLGLHMETGAESGMQRALGRAVSWTEWLWVSCSTSLSLSIKGG